MEATRNEAKINIADIGIRLQWEGAVIDNRDPSLYDNFAFTDDKSADTTLRIYNGRFPEYRPERIIFDAAKNHWKLYESGHRYIIEIFSATPPHTKESVILIEKDFTVGELWINWSYDANPLEEEEAGLGKEEQNTRNGRYRTKQPGPPLFRLMRPLGEILVINHLSRGNGVLVHAFGVDDRGKGIAFLGPSGAGKSTLAGLYRRRADDTVILNDERLVIKKENNIFWLYSTPWPGMDATAINHKVELKKIFFIEHGRHNKVIA